MNKYMLMCNPIIQQIKKIPSNITNMDIIDGISLECMKEIVKLKQITTLELHCFTPSDEMIMEILKSKTITTLICRHNDNINKSIVLKDICYIVGYHDTTTVIRMINYYYKKSYTVGTSHNYNNWHQKYMIL